jgi:hypothetical protein
MAGKNTAVFGIYPSYTTVEMGVDGLKAGGFSNRDISVLLPESAGSRDFAHEKGTKAPEGATTGAGTGVVLGGAMGWLLGVGALAIPGLGPFHCCRSDHGNPCGCGRRGRSRWNCRSSDWNGNSGIRGQALRRQSKGWWHSAIGSLR